MHLNSELWYVCNISIKFTESQYSNTVSNIICNYTMYHSLVNVLGNIFPVTGDVNWDKNLAFYQKQKDN